MSLRHTLLLTVISSALVGVSKAEPPLPRIDHSIILEHDDGKFLWYHPRVAPIPAAEPGDVPLVLMTLQKHLHTSDHYSGLYTMTTADLGRTWIGPTEIPSLAWGKDSSGATVAVCDVTPGWHAPTERLLAIGVKVRYDDAGTQLLDLPGSFQVAYAVYDPKTTSWSGWEIVELPLDDGRFHLAVAGCAQWVVEPDGAILVPMYHKPKDGESYSATVLRCRFDGRKLTLAEMGQTLELAEPRGLCEPSLTKVDDDYYLTLRNDVRGYVTRSKDGLHYEPIRPWTFDDGSELGSYNTQQHWLTTGNRLWLVYTRRGANNDHIMRHRAPLFLAEVDRDKLHVLRATERVLIPERGGEMGNFGAAQVRPGESWVTVGEGVWNEDARRRGATGAIIVARVISPAP